MMNSTKALKTPWPLKILAVCFLVAPIGNIVMSFAGGTLDWYRPSIFFSLLQSISLGEWIWLSMIFISGVLLLIQHKLAWTAASTTLVAVLGVNIYKSFLAMDNLTSHVIPMKYQLAFSGLVTLVILMVVFYARYPYLDRRDSWFGKAAQRFQVHLKTKVTASGEGRGWIESLSLSGARLKWSQSLDLPELEVVELNIENLPVSQLRARVIECNDQILRVRFLYVSKEDKIKMSEWLENQNGHAKAS